ncbi:hypothetical protein ACQEWB_49625 [Streptomyces sp. CA-249302]|uniref:hypothetical protein n=1 Tax=Streptomyces sp. CA-249302 TaxID=3240058 RepID=UPI003D913556
MAVHLAFDLPPSYGWRGLWSADARRSTSVTTWDVERHDARENTMMGASSMHPDEIVRYEVRTMEGEHLVTLPVQ